MNASDIAPRSSSVIRRSPSVSGFVIPSRRSSSSRKKNQREDRDISKSSFSKQLQKVTPSSLIETRLPLMRKEETSVNNASSSFLLDGAFDSPRSSFSHNPSPSPSPSRFPFYPSGPLSANRQKVAARFGASLTASPSPSTPDTASSRFSLAQKRVDLNHNRDASLRGGFRTTHRYEQS